MRVIGSLLILQVATAPAPAKPIATLRELGPALTACFRAPERSAGSEITVQFSLTRQGTVLGQPRITYSKLMGKPEDRTTFVEAVLKSLASCTPVALTPGLGGAIAGRPFSIRFVGGGRAEGI